MKRLMLLFFAVLAAAIFAFPTLAETAPALTTEGIAAVSEPGDELPGEMETTTLAPTTTQAPMTTTEHLTLEAIPISLAPDELSAFQRADYINYAALGASLLALLLAIIALAKSGKKVANATGNYKKFF